MDPQATDDPVAVRRWPSRLRMVAAVGWSSFLAASIGTMLVFAALDPEMIIAGFDSGEPGIQSFWLTRTGIYSLGFFLLWLVAAVAAALTVALMQTPGPEKSGQS
ncbi:MAG: hypothetical protein OEW88_11790 [Gammaproteobacteria bacterium]|nr:hypothetical protein [Gammaproteobacteria bacterium]